MQHYATYRAQIRRMSEDTPTMVGQDGNLDELSSAASVASAISYGIPSMLEEEGEGPSEKHLHANPYKDYLHRRRRLCLVQLIVLVVLAAGFAIWMITLIQRS